MMSSDSSIDRDQLQPWQFFTLAGLAGATAVVFVTRDNTPAAVILLGLTVGAAAFVGIAAWRTLGPLAGVQTQAAADVLGGRTRAALEREKTLVLRSIKDLEFDRAMGKVSEKDFAEMSARLRARATGLIRELDRGLGYRDAIERELANRLRHSRVALRPDEAVLAGRSADPADRSGGQDGLKAPPRAAPKPRGESGCSCGTANDPDARFCKSCGQRLTAA